MLPTSSCVFTLPSPFPVTHSGFSPLCAAATRAPRSQEQIPHPSVRNVPLVPWEGGCDLSMGVSRYHVGLRLSPFSQLNNSPALPSSMLPSLIPESILKLQTANTPRLQQTWETGGIMSVFLLEVGWNWSLLLIPVPFIHIPGIIWCACFIPSHLWWAELGEISSVIRKLREAFLAVIILSGS